MLMFDTELRKLEQQIFDLTATPGRGEFPRPCRDR